MMDPGFVGLFWYEWDTCVYIYTLFLIVNVNNKTCDSLCIHKERQININKHKKYVINKYLAMFCLGMVENRIKNA